MCGKDLPDKEQRRRDATSEDESGERETAAGRDAARKYKKEKNRPSPKELGLAPSSV